MGGTQLDKAPFDPDTAGDAWVLFATAAGIFSPCRPTSCMMEL